MSNELSYSRYNHMVKLKEGEWGLINLFSMAAKRLDSLSKEIFEHILEDGPDSKMAKKFKKLGFLVDHDEVLAYRAAHKFSMTNNRLFSFTICPTLDCNFRCPYCFEEHSPGAMSEETQKRVVITLGRILDETNPISLNINWFGGEPLLYPKIVENLSKEFIKLAEDRKIKYESFMITNGYLLDQAMIDRMEKCEISRIQVTLDGMKEINDKSRISIDGKSSFDVITNNLRTIRTNARIVVRFNANKENMNDYESLKEYIADIAKESGNNIVVYAAHMDALGDVPDAVIEKAIDMPEFFEDEAGRPAEARYVKLDHSKFIGCGMNKLYAFAIDHEGGMYKCWNSVGKEEEKVASVYDGGNPAFNQIFSKFGAAAVGYDPADDEECRECKLLPQCNGGCIYVKSLQGKAGVCIKDAMLPALDDMVIRYFADKVPE